jgi:N6-adenosine-specific RNA methylase IME4
MSGKYRTIVADPPWAYDEGWPDASTSPNSAYNRGVAPIGRQKRVELPYSSMTIDDIGNLPVKSLAADDAHLFLWTTNRYLRDSFLVAEAWGFRPSQTLTWCKSRRGIGPGGVFASTSEFLIYCRRGRPDHLQRADSTWFQWPRAAHSVKPDAFLDLVEQMVPGPYVELFARRARFGWDYWGDESLGTAEMPGTVA